MFKKRKIVVTIFYYLLHIADCIHFLVSSVRDSVDRVKYRRGALEFRPRHRHGNSDSSFNVTANDATVV